MSATHTVHLIDASPYVFRAWFSLPGSIVDPAGAPVNAVRGFASFLAKYLREEEPSHVAVAFDESLTTSFRNDLYPPYKAQRELPPQELVDQLAACKELASALGTLTFADERYEADDLIGTLARRVVRQGHAAVVVTSDKDLAQLVGPRVVLFDYAKDTRYGPDEVREKFGVTPEQIPDYLGLAGDSVDNIPGVKGIGAKTAVRLLEEFGDLERLYAGLSRVAKMSLRGAARVAERLAADKEMAFLSRELATIAHDAPAAAGLRELAWKGADRARLEEVCERIGFGTLAQGVSRWAVHSPRR